MPIWANSRWRKRRSDSQFEDQRRVVGDAGEALRVRVAYHAGACGQGVRQKRVVDAEPVSPGAEPRIFPKFRIAAAPQVAKSDLGHSVHVVRGSVDGARLVEVGTAVVEVADGEGVPASLAQGGDQRLPVWDFREEVRHVDAD